MNQARSVVATGKAASATGARASEAGKHATGRDSRDAGRRATTALPSGPPKSQPRPCSTPPPLRCPMADSLYQRFSSLSVSASSCSGSRDNRPCRSGGGGSDRIDALGRLLTRILRHMAPKLRLDIRSDGYVRVQDLLALNMSTYAKVPLREHSLDDVREAVRKDNKQRFSLLAENGELLIRANQGHTIRTISSESLLKPILSSHEVPVCVHGTYKKNLESILKSGLKRMTRLHIHFACGLPGEVISGIRQNVNILIFLNVEKALQKGMKLYISDNKVILTEGFDGVVPVRYFEKIETWPGREAIPFSS